jgi:hypothetical protein
MSEKKVSSEFYLPSSLYDSLQLSLLEDFQIIGEPITSIAVCSGCDPELRRYVTAAAKAYYLGLRSVDRILKSYGQYWSFENTLDDEEKLCRDILDQVKKEVSKTVEWICNIRNKPERIGLFSAEVALLRLEASFVVASFLIKKGYNFEAMGVCRLILEQIAWAYEVHELEDETVFRFPSSKSIARLRKLLPKAGQLYGFLSDRAHISPSLVPGYVAFKEDNQEVTLATAEGSAFRAFILLSLTDYFGIVSEYIYREFPSAFFYIQKGHDGNFCVKKSRPMSKVIEQYRSSIFSKKSGK